MQRLIAAVLLITVVVAPSFAAPPEISAEDAQRDLRIAKRGLLELHPGTFRYLTPAALDAEFAAAAEQVQQGSDHAQMFLLLTRLAASVRCGHTWTNNLNQPQLIQQKLFGRNDKLPLTVKLIGQRLLVSASTTEQVPAGSEIIAIDGFTVAELIAELKPYLRADGSSDGKRLAQIDHRTDAAAIDRLWPLLHPPKQLEYRLTIRHAGKPREVSVLATTTAARSAALKAQGISAPSEEWQFSIDGDTATLTLPTFAFWESNFDGNAYLDRVFAELKAKKARFLIIDIRANEGGDDAFGRKLLSELLAHPHTQPGYQVESAYERAPYILARYMDTWDFGFFDRTGKVRKGSGRNWLLIEQPAPRVITPVKDRWNGKTIVLIGPNNSSAGYLLARDIQQSHAALLIGEPTGGNLRGLNGGELAWMTLPASQISFDIPLIAAMPIGEVADAGITPEIVITPDFDLVAKGVDQAMLAAHRQIKAWR